MAEAQWHYESGDESKGPVTTEQLRELIANETVDELALVWQEGMDEWAPAARFDQLVPGGIAGVKPTPPPPHINDDNLRYILPTDRTPLSVAAGYAGLFAFLIIPAPLALLLGLLALRQLKNHPEKLGRGRAWFGTITGALGTALIAFYILLLAIIG